MRDDKPIFYDPDSDPTPISVQPDEISQLRERIRRLEEFVLAFAKASNPCHSPIASALNQQHAQKLLDDIQRQHATQAPVPTPTHHKNHPASHNPA